MSQPTAADFRAWFTDDPIDVWRLNNLPEFILVDIAQQRWVTETFGGCGPGWRELADGPVSVVEETNG